MATQVAQLKTDRDIANRQIEELRAGHLRMRMAISERKEEGGT